jgi:hypothetical protein
VSTCTKWVNRLVIECKNWSTKVDYECTQWADEGSYECDRWADEGSRECEEWGKKCRQDHRRLAAEFGAFARVSVVSPAEVVVKIESCRDRASRA